MHDGHMVPVASDYVLLWALELPNAWQLRHTGYALGSLTLASHMSPQSCDSNGRISQSGG